MDCYRLRNAAMRTRHIAEGAPELALLESKLDITLPDGAIGIATYTDKGDVAAIIALMPQQRGDITLHMYAWRGYWATPSFLRDVFTKVFIEQGALRATILAHTNLRVIWLAYALGFKLEGKMEGYDFGTLYAFGLKAGDCKWVH